MNYFDAVVCWRNNERRMYRAPAFSQLKDGDTVIVETTSGKAIVTVIASYTVRCGDELFDFLTKAMALRLPLRKVLSKVLYSDYAWEDENEQSDSV